MTPEGLREVRALLKEYDLNAEDVLDSRAQIKRKNAVWLVVGCLSPNGDKDTRERARSRVSKRISEAVKKGSLFELSNHVFSDRKFRQWAAETWPKECRDLWLGVRVNPGALRMTGQNVDLRLDEFPTDLPACRVEIAALRGRVRELEAEIASLRPAAERYRENVETARRNAKRPRGAR